MSEEIKIKNPIQTPVTYDEKYNLLINGDGMVLANLRYDGKHRFSPLQVRKIGKTIAETLNKEAENKWIPVSERLPDTDRAVWLTVIDGSERKVVRANYRYRSSWAIGDEFLEDFDYQPIAWWDIETPAPYEG